jgi:hypothetical protein
MKGSNGDVSDVSCLPSNAAIVALRGGGRSPLTEGGRTGEVSSVISAPSVPFHHHPVTSAMIGNHHSNDLQARPAQEVNIGA